MRTRLWHAPTLLFLLQAPPVDARLDEFGRFRMALGLGRGGYQQPGITCGSTEIKESKVTYKTVGGNAEAWVTPRVRLGVSGGVLHSSSDPDQETGRDGAFGGFTAGAEQEKFGIGAGIMLWPKRAGRSYEVLPSFYLRGGPADRAHFRIDEGAASVPGTVPGVRLGVASGFGQQRRTRLFVGFMLLPLGAEEGGGGFGTLKNWSPLFGGELGIPLGLGLEPTVQGAIGPYSLWNLGIGLRAVFGRSARTRSARRTPS